MAERLFNRRVLQQKPKTSTLVFDLVAFSAPNDDIPLEENWAERWSILPSTYTHVLDEVLNFDVRPDDVFVLTFPKCGTTWMQEAAWLLLNNLDYERAKKVSLSDRSPNFDGSGAVPRTPSTMQQCRDLPSPRLLKSHLLPNLLPRQAWQKKSKMIFVARNMKDIVVSNYKFFGNLRFIQGTMDDCVDDFVKCEAIFMPYLERVVDFYKMRDEPNIFFTTYEDMHRDLGDVLQRLCTFLERPQLSKDELKELCEHLSFDKMKDNKKSHIEDYLTTTTPIRPVDGFKFMRRGIVGAYKDEMSPRNQEILDTHAKELLGKHGLTERMIFGDF